MPQAPDMTEQALHLLGKVDESAVEALREKIAQVLPPGSSSNTITALMEQASKLFVAGLRPGTSIVQAVGLFGALSTIVLQAIISGAAASDCDCPACDTARELLATMPPPATIN